MDLVGYSKDIFDLCFKKITDPGNPLLKSMSIYRDLLRDNIKIALKSALPRLHTLLKADELTILLDNFLDCGIQGRHYRDIPSLFYNWLMKSDDLIDLLWLRQLVSYEVALYDLFYELKAAPLMNPAPLEAALSDLKSIFDPSFRSFEFDYPVSSFEKLSRHEIVTQKSYLVLYRTRDYRVKEFEITQAQSCFLNSLSKNTVGKSLENQLKEYPQSDVSEWLTILKSWVDRGFIRFELS